MVKPSFRNISSFFLIFVLLLAGFTPSFQITLAEDGTGLSDEKAEEDLKAEDYIIDPSTNDEGKEEQDEEGKKEMTSQSEGTGEGTITIHSPDNYTLTNEQTLLVSGTYTNTPYELHLIGVSEENIKILNFSEGTWQIELENLKDGTYEFYVQAYDEEGPIENVVSDSRILVIHTIAPILTVQTPEHHSYTNQLFFSGTWESSIELGPEFESDFVPSIEFYLFKEEKEIGNTEAVIILADKEDSIDDNGVWNWEISMEKIKEELEMELDFEDGEYYFYLKTIDAAGNERVLPAKEEADEIEPFMFTYHTARPYITPNVTPKHKATQVPITIEAITANYVGLEIDPEYEIQKMMKVLKENKVIEGTVTFEEKTGEIRFEPTKGVLSVNTRYEVIIDPLLKDIAGNYINPRIWSFTTESRKVTSAHVVIANNTNTCATCHSTHTADSRNLVKGNMDLPRLEEENKEGAIQEPDGGVSMDPIQAYCLACHDGTTAAPMAQDVNATYIHDKTLITEGGEEKIGTCSSCHDPHVQTVEGNRNTHHLQSHFTFDHDKLHNPNTEGIGKIDSKITLCETCHINDSFERYGDGEFILFQYENRNSYSVDKNGNPVMFGSTENYSLCVRCHNADYQKQYPNVSDILKYYKDASAASSGHFITNDRVKDGSLLNGNLACDDCHNRHGSNNEMLINSVLGHNGERDKDGNRIKFSWSGPRDTVKAQRDFCLSCHNETTELYGLNPSYMEEEGSVHRQNKDKSCADCHGGPEKDFTRAVHTPTRGSLQQDE
ncbi:formate-dependent nitrite reductase cytochrome c552 subunit [Evansella vedderi]|uniref:Formate-dependent nitrite reductase cytochrome c552 subunit n=1 Tax=Evansella vedderi TaxID=38282 RepID=A0ABU0A0D1_9BACI|nr:cytochrome c3 family protein [Evansella vedderi]MDQ0256670.1 formate-dependent nitrite reductase cytochrome c552 subunit [Evansella vedderi]